MLDMDSRQNVLEHHQKCTGNSVEIFRWQPVSDQARESTGASTESTGASTGCRIAANDRNSRKHHQVRLQQQMEHAKQTTPRATLDCCGLCALAVSEPLLLLLADSTTARHQAAVLPLITATATTSDITVASTGIIHPSIYPSIYRSSRVGVDGSRRRQQAYDACVIRA